MTIAPRPSAGRRMLIALGLLLAAALAAPAQAQNRFWLVNATGVTIQEAYVSSSRVSVWGPDILGTGVLPPGQQVWVTPAFGDCVLDVRVRYANGAEDTRMGVNACAITRIVFGGGGSAFQQPGAGAGAVLGAPAGLRNPSFTFVNGSGATIREIYASLSTNNNWGPDRLGANVLPSGSQVFIPLPQGGSCNTDIRVVYMNGQTFERRGVETCSVTNYVWR